jgi:hypothetical protein
MGRVSCGAQEMMWPMGTFMEAALFGSNTWKALSCVFAGMYGFSCFLGMA